jgi:haloacetate dehalogenase
VKLVNWTRDGAVLAPWGERSLVGRTYDVLDVWRDYAPDVPGWSVPAGHYLPEEAPGEVTNALAGFFG